MLRVATTLILGVCWAGYLLDASTPVVGQEPAPKPAAKSSDNVAWQAKIEAALQKPMTVEFQETPLEDVVAFLKSQTGQQLLIDKKSLDNAGIGTDTPVTCKFANIRFRSILQHVLRPLGLQFVLRDGALVITSSEEAEKILHEEVFDVTDLVRPVGTAELPGCDDGDSLSDAIRQTVAPQSWPAGSGPSGIPVFRGQLVVSQTHEVQEEIRRWLAAYRKAKQLAAEYVDKAPPVVSFPNELDDAATAEIYQALDRQITLEFRETPLEDVVEYLRQTTKVNIAIDRRALDNVGIAGDTPISFEAQALPLRHALRHILPPIGCTWCVRDQVLLLTSNEEGEKDLVARAYPVADLLGREGSDVFGNPHRPATVDALKELLTTTVAPQAWDHLGGTGSVAYCGSIDVLVILQTLQVHEQIVALLGRLRQNLAQAPQNAAGDKTRPRNDSTRLVIYQLPTASPPPQVAPPAAPNAGNPAPNAPGPANTPPLSHVPVGNTVSGAPLLESQLMQLITELIEPDSWKSRKDVYLRAVSGRLLVRHTEAVQQQVQALLLRLGMFTVPPMADGGMGMGGGRFHGMSGGGTF